MPHPQPALRLTGPPALRDPVVGDLVGRDRVGRQETGIVTAVVDPAVDDTSRAGRSVSSVRTKTR